MVPENSAREASSKLLLPVPPIADLTLDPDAGEFLEPAELAGFWRVREHGQPISRRNLTDIHVTGRIQRYAVWGDELAGLQTRTVTLVDTPQELAASAEHTDARAEIGGEPIDAEVRHQFADDAVWSMTASDRESAWSVHIDDLRFVFSVPVKDLHPIIFAISDVDPAIGVTADVVR